MEGWFFLDVVVWQWSSIFKLLSGKDKSLLVWGNSFLVLDFSLDSFNWIRWFNIKSDGFSGQGLNEDLHTSSESQDQMEGWFLLDIVVWQWSSVFKLLSSENESLLIWGYSFLVLDLALDSLDGIWGFNVESDGFSGEGFDKDLHLFFFNYYKRGGFTVNLKNQHSDGFF